MGGTPGLAWLPICISWRPRAMRAGSSSSPLSPTSMTCSKLRCSSMPKAFWSFPTGQATDSTGALRAFVACRKVSASPNHDSSRRKPDMNVLFVGAHPDDIEIFCGGTAALYAKQGHQVFFCVSTNGNVGSATLPPKEIAAIRHKEAEAGASVIGAKLIWLDFDDEFLFDSRESRMAFIE